MSVRDEVSALYESYPYPPVGRIRSLLTRVDREKLPTLGYQTGYKACYGDLKGAAEQPRILVAGCGAFEPVVVALANPGAEIVALDLSARSLREVEWQAKWRGLKSQIRTVQGEIESLPASLGTFDYVIATGVIHHLENPLRGLQKLKERTHAKSVFRFMVYSRWGRAPLYQTKELARLLGIREPGRLRQMISALPADHPYRIYFHLYSDARTDAGLCDGYLHPCDRAFTALELGSLLAEAGLEFGSSLQRPEGRPEAIEALLPECKNLAVWEKMALLECYGLLEENFLFFAKPGRVIEPRRKVVSRGLPKIEDFANVLSPAGTLHSERLREAKRIAGEEAAERLAVAVGPYELETELAHSLRLTGLEIPANDELKFLTPANWLKSEAVSLGEWKKSCEEEGRKLETFSLSPAEESALDAFLRRMGKSNLDSWERLEIADHFLLRPHYELRFTERAHRP